MTPRSRGRPEAGERRPVRGLAQLLERALADLTDALARDAHEGTDALERHRLGAFLEPVVQVEDLPLARREVATQRAVDVLAHELEVRGLLDVLPLLGHEALAEGAGVAVGAVDGGVEGDLGGGELTRGADRLRLLVEHA